MRKPLSYALLGLASCVATPAQAIGGEEEPLVVMVFGCHCNPGDITDPGVDQILRDFAGSDPNLVVQIVAPGDVSQYWYKKYTYWKPVEEWQIPWPQLYPNWPYVHYEQHLSMNNGHLPGDPGFGDGGAGHAPQPVYVAATVCAAGICNTEWIIVGYV